MGEQYQPTPMQAATDLERDERREAERDVQQLFGGAFENFLQR